MKKNRQIPCEEFQIIYVDTQPWRKWSTTSTPSCGLRTGTSLQRHSIGAGRGHTGARSNWMAEKPGQYHLSQCKFHIRREVMLTVDILDTMWWNGVLPVVFLPQTDKPSLIMRKTSGKYQLRDNLQIPNQYSSNYSPKTRSEKSEKQTKPRDISGDMTATCHVVSWVGLWTDKGR